MAISPRIPSVVLPVIPSRVRKSISSNVPLIVRILVAALATPKLRNFWEIPWSCSWRNPYQKSLKIICGASDFWQMLCQLFFQKLHHVSFHEFRKGLCVVFHQGFFWRFTSNLSWIPPLTAPEVQLEVLPEISPTVPEGILRGVYQGFFLEIHQGLLLECCFIPPTAGVKKRVLQVITAAIPLKISLEIPPYRNSAKKFIQELR